MARHVERRTTVCRIFNWKFQLPVASFQFLGWRPRAASLLETGHRKLATKLFDIVWDDSRTGARIGRPQNVRPQATSFPVVIGEGSHPFPFRTRKLSSLPPMVLHA